MRSDKPNVMAIHPVNAKPCNWRMGIGCAGILSLAMRGSYPAYRRNATMWNEPPKRASAVVTAVSENTVIRTANRAEKRNQRERNIVVPIVKDGADMGTKNLRFRP